jgi:hypothetical protein
MTITEHNRENEMKRQQVKKLVESKNFPDQERRNKVAMELILEENAGHGFGSCVMQSILLYALTGKNESKTWPASEYHMNEINTRYVCN